MFESFEERLNLLGRPQGCRNTQSVIANSRMPKKGSQGEKCEIVRRDESDKYKGISRVVSKDSHGVWGRRGGGDGEVREVMK